MPKDGMRPVRHGGYGKFLAKREDGGANAENRRGGLSDKIARQRAERHGDEHGKQANRRADDVDEGDRLEPFECLKGVLVDGGDRADERGSDDQESERAFGNANALEEGRKNEP